MKQAKAKAEALLAGSFVEHTEECQWTATGCTCGREELRDEVAAALDEARSEGRKEALGDAVPLKDLMAETLAEARRDGAERERWECWRAVNRALGICSDRDMGIVALETIAARGPMRGPKEEA